MYEALLLNFSESDKELRVDPNRLKEAFCGEVWLGQMLSKYLLEEHGHIFGLISSDAEKGLIRNLLDSGIELNLLELVVQDVPNDRFGQLIPGSYLCRLNSFLYKLAYILKSAHLTEVNLYSICLCFE